MDKKMLKNVIKILLRRLSIILFFILLGLDISFAEEIDYISKFEREHPILYIGILSSLVVGWLFFCTATGLDSELWKD